MYTKYSLQGTTAILYYFLKVVGCVSHFFSMARSTALSVHCRSMLYLFNGHCVNRFQTSPLTYNVYPWFLYRSGQYEFPNPEWKNVSMDAKELIKGCLRTNPDERLTIDQVIKNKWISVSLQVAGLFSNWHIVNCFV